MEGAEQVKDDKDEDLEVMSDFLVDDEAGETEEESEEEEILSIRSRLDRLEAELGLAE